MPIEKFSKLDKTEKTFGHITEFYKAIKFNIPLSAVDNNLQSEELREHLNGAGCADEKARCEEEARWVAIHGAKCRKYLNSLHVFTLFIYMDNLKDFRDNISKDIVFHFIDIWNIEKDMIMETIRFEKMETLV